MRIGVARKSYYHTPWCGDAAYTHEDEERALLAVVDGLGHNIQAARAAEAATACLEACKSLSLDALLSAVEQALSATAGAALTLAVIYKGRGLLEVCGIGNVVLQLATPHKLYHFSGHPGIAGAGPAICKKDAFPYQPGDLVVMYTDGIRSAFSAAELAHIQYPDPQRIAQRILREYARPNDDALALVACETERQ